MFNLGGVKDAKVVSNNFLSAGIHDVYFRGIDKAEGFSAAELRFEAVDGSGVHNERIFEPRSDKRTESQYGTNPSEAEQFMCTIKQVIAAIDPELDKKIEADGDKFKADTFDGFIALLKKHLDKKLGAQTQIKLVPGSSGNFVNFPRFIANISKDGNLYMRNKVIGNDLVLTPKEKAAIDNAANARPTNMRNRAAELDDLKDDFGVDTNEDDNDMPF